MENADQEELDALAQTCAALGVDPVCVRSASKEQHVVAARRRVAARLKGMGWPGRKIARLLSRSIRTVQRIPPR